MNPLHGPLPQKRARGPLFVTLDIVLNVIVILVLVMGIRTFLVSPFRVEGNSMVQTLEDRDYIIINKLVYFLQKPLRGEIVVFRPPNDPSKYYVKRVIGVPGDTVTLRNGRVFIRAANAAAETELQEPYLSPENAGNTSPNVQEPSSVPVSYTVPSDSYFLMGDNRTKSHDSRSFMVNGNADPFVTSTNIKGRVWFVAFPFSRIQSFSRSDALHAEESSSGTEE